MEKIKISKEQWCEIEHNVRRNLESNCNVIGYLKLIFDIQKEEWANELELARQPILESQCNNDGDFYRTRYVDEKCGHYEKCVYLLFDKIKKLENKE
ncbi:MAG: hypothetical protein PHP92_03435 [Candidatus Nanoarchaeia archaeon]|nr:hypothetical protein [Candidatus Nanoarchaeia archaeon]